MTKDTPSLTWEYGMTSCLKRTESRAESIVSLKSSGFPELPLFVDGPRVNTWTKSSRAAVIGAFGNWVLTAWELFLRNPLADRYAIFQDDIVCSRNLRQFLDLTTTHERAYWNCCLWRDNADGRNGWYQAPSGCGLGAQSLVFSNAGMVALLSDPLLVRHAQDKFRGTRAIDGIVKTAMGYAGYTEMVHSPSPVRHVGTTCSTLQTQKYPETANFMGEQLDLLSCIEQKVNI